MTEKNAGPEPAVPKGSKATASPSPGGKNKFLAVIIALIVVIVALSYLDFHGSLGGSTTVAKVSSSSQLIETGQNLNVTIKAQNSFSYALIYFGDGTVVNYTYNGSTTFNVSHSYSSPGNYFVFFKVFYGKSVYSSYDKLVQVSVASKFSQQNSRATYGVFDLLNSSSKSTVGNNTLVYKPGTSLSFALGYSTEPSNASYQVFFQSVSVSGAYNSVDSVSYQYNYSSMTYQLPQKSALVNLTDLSTGYYQVAIKTETANLTATNVSGKMMYLGQINHTEPVYSTVYYEDIVISSNAGLYTSSGPSGIFLNAEVVTGVDNNMDYALQDTVSGQEVVDQVIQYLVAFNGSSDTSYKPELATQLPTISNGGINSNYANYSVTAPWGKSYTVHIKPYENYTFKIRANATYSDGSPVTAWDFLYSMARTMVFAASVNAQGGYLGEFLLPGDYSSSNTFWNITQNITVNNATNSITIHFQKPQPTAVAYQLLATDGSEAESAAWYAAHGAGMTWTPKGFQSYKVFGEPSHYNTYTQDHLMSDGPYKLAYIVPGSEVVLVANPSFVSPGPWDPAPSIGQITIEYISSAPTAYLLLKSGAASAASLPSSNWNEVQQLVSQGKVKVYNFNELSFNFFNFNANINETQLGKQDSSANVPQTLFMNQNVRKAFAFTFNYSYYINYQVGNKLYNNTFEIPYAGYLPKGGQYYESISQLNASGSTVPYYDLKIAHQYWNSFINGSGSDSGSAMGVTMLGDVAMFNGKQLQLPIYVPNTDPSVSAGASSWASALASFGVKATVTAVPEDNIFVLTAGQNYMPIAWGGWFSSFAFPNRITSLGLPRNDTAYIGSNSFNQWWFSGGGGSSPTSNATQAANMKQMIADFNNALANGTNSVLAQKWYWKANGMLINASYVVFIGQGVGQWILSTKLNNQNILNYELNPFEAGVDRLMYNGLAFNTTS